MAQTRNPLDGAVFDLSSRTKLRLTGEDRQRFLNGQITNDVRKVRESNAIAACILSAKGKTDAHVFVSQNNESYLLDAESELREILSARLERYIIADDVEIEDVTDNLSILHVIGVTNFHFSSGRVVSANRFGVSGFDVWTEKSRQDAIRAALGSSIPYFDSEQAEVFRIERGVPRWGRELTSEIIPVEANLEESCIDYDKGCYIGQEVISRMKMSGQRNKRLCGFISNDESVLVEGARLVSREGKEAGWITSATASERFGRRIALGYIKRGAAAPAGMKIVDLPFSAGSIGSG